jgi:hypothetical protein
VPQTVGEISMVGPACRVAVTFSNEGIEYAVVLTLTPSADEVLLLIDVSSGQAQMNGTAKKKS